MWKLSSNSSAADITPRVKNVYRAYLGIKLGDQDEVLAPHRVCRRWGCGALLAFGIPMVWREPKEHGKECYFCLCVVDGWVQC